MGHFTHVYDTTHGVIGYPDLVWVPGEGESIGITHDASGNPLPNEPKVEKSKGGGVSIDLSSIEKTNTVIAVKGSRSSRMDEVSDILIN